MLDTSNPPRKRPVNLSIDAELLAEAKTYGINVSGTLEAALREVIRKERWARWRTDNRAATEASNRELEKNGLWADKFRAWRALNRRAD